MRHCLVRRMCFVVLSKGEISVLVKAMNVRSGVKKKAIRIRVRFWRMWRVVGEEALRGIVLLVAVDATQQMKMKDITIIPREISCLRNLLFGTCQKLLENHCDDAVGFGGVEVTFKVQFIVDVMTGAKGRIESGAWLAALQL